MIVHRTFLIGTFHYEFEYLKVSLIRVFIINFVKDQFAYIKWTWRSSLMQWCGEQRLYLSYSANADRTLSQSTCSSLILSWPATPQSGSSLYIVLPADNIFSLLLALNLSRSLHSLKWRWLNRSTSLHFAAPLTSVDVPTPFHRLATTRLKWL